MKITDLYDDVILYMESFLDPFSIYCFRSVMRDIPPRGKIGPVSTFNPNRLKEMELDYKDITIRPIVSFIPKIEKNTIWYPYESYNENNYFCACLLPPENRCFQEFEAVCRAVYWGHVKCFHRACKLTPVFITDENDTQLKYRLATTIIYQNNHMHMLPLVDKKYKCHQKYVNEDLSLLYGKSIESTNSINDVIILKIFMNDKLRDLGDAMYIQRYLAHILRVVIKFNNLAMIKILLEFYPSTIKNYLPDFMDNDGSLYTNTDIGILTLYYPNLKMYGGISYNMYLLLKDIIVLSPIIYNYMDYFSDKAVISQMCDKYGVVNKNTYLRLKFMIFHCDSIKLLKKVSEIYSSLKYIDLFEGRIKQLISGWV